MRRAGIVTNERSVGGAFCSAVRSRHAGARLCCEYGPIMASTATNTVCRSPLSFGPFSSASRNLGHAETRRRAMRRYNESVCFAARGGTDLDDGAIRFSRTPGIYMNNL